MKVWTAVTLALAFCATSLVSADKDPVGLTADQRVEVDAGETHEFQAEVSRLMDIIINSLYSNRDIFLRELISNAADASDKIRYEALKDASLLGEGDLAELDIKIEFNKEDKTVTLTDKGIGMTKDNLLKNLGIVAKSGTTEFLAAAGKGEDLSLIGQFGVGFYSVYLVADKVTVVSKHNDDKQHVWESTANSVFTIAEDPRGNTLGRGTSITLHLKEDAEEFLDQKILKETVTRYSQFVNVPIYLKTTKTVSKEVPIEEEEKEDKEEGDKADDDIEISEEEEEGEEVKPTTKMIKEQVEDWERINAVKAVWTRDPKEVTEEEYNDFFMAFTDDKFDDGAADHIHFTAEGEISFKSLLYIPVKAASGQYNDLFTLKKSGVSLYVRRVLISDEFEDFLPRYLNFVKGVVDSDDIPLNVSRETLAQSRVLKVMSKKLVRKILELLRKMADAAEGTEVEEDPEQTEEEKEAAVVVKEEAWHKYNTFWKEHGKSIKFGVIDDRKNKAKLTKLLRYETSKSEGEFVSLSSYVARMKEEQKYIYFVTGESLERVKKSPFLEKVTGLDYEVVYMVDPVDEHVVSAMSEFDGIELQSVTKEGLNLGDEERKVLKDLKKEYKPLTEWFKGVFGNAVEKVVVSNRLGESPCVLVTGQYGWSANMQRIINGATLSSSNQQNTAMAGRKTLEINVMHPIMQSLNSKMGNADESLKDLAFMLLDASIMSSGFSITDYTPFNKRMTNLVSAGLGLDSNAPVEEEAEDAEEEEEEEEKDEEEVEEEEVVEAEEAEAPHEEL